MDYKEAIDYIKWMQGSFYSDKSHEACDMAIAALKKQEKAEDEWCTDCKEYSHERHCCPRFNRVIRETVEECKKEWANEGWVPVSEKPPEEDGYYLVSVRNEHGRGYSKTARFCQGTWPLVRQKVLAWRRLPKPYEEVE